MCVCVCIFFFSLPGRSQGRAIVLPPGVGGGGGDSKMLMFFYVMGKALSGELSCPCDRSCFFFSFFFLFLSQLAQFHITYVSVFKLSVKPLKCKTS